MEQVCKILSSLVPLEARYTQDYHVIDQEDTTYKFSKSGLETFKNLKYILLQAVENLIGYQVKKDNADIGQLLIWIVSSLAFHELTCYKHVNGFIERCILFLCIHMGDLNASISCAATKGLDIIIQANLFSVFDDNIIALIIKEVCDSIANLLKSYAQTSQSISVLYGFLADLIVLSPKKLIYSAGISVLLSSLIEETLNMTNPEHATTLVSTGAKESMESIRKSCQNFLLQILRHGDNYPSIFGETIINSAIEDPDEQNHRFYAFQGRMIVTLIEEPETSTCRLIIRDPVGRHCWEFASLEHSKAAMMCREIPEPENGGSLRVQVKDIRQTVGIPLLSVRTLNSFKSDVSSLKADGQDEMSLLLKK
jgi:hypothetical protein